MPSGNALSVPLRQSTSSSLSMSGTPRDELSSARGRPSDEETILEESPSKKAKDAARSAELYVHPSGEKLEMFDSEDLDDDGIYMLLIGSSQVYAWVGADADPSVDVEGAGRSFLDSRGLQGAQVTVVAQDEEPEEFWTYFVNG